MKQGALLVNVARGPLVIEADLVAALESRHLSGAVMDVTEQEPLADRAKRLWGRTDYCVLSFGSCSHF